MNTRSIPKKLVIAAAVIVLVIIAVLFITFYPKAAAASTAATATPTATEPSLKATPEPTPSETPEPTSEPFPSPTTEVTPEQNAEEASPKPSVKPKPAPEDEGEHAGQSEPSSVPAPETKKSKPVILENTIVDTSTQLYTYSEMADDLSALADKYPDYVKVSVLAVTADGRNIYLARVGNPNAGKEMLVHAALHAREYMTAMLAMSQLEYYLTNWNTEYKKGVTYGDIFNSVCLYMIPMVNPDGVTISQYGAKGINNSTLRAKFLKMEGSDKPSRWKANVNGVNLNRNFDSYWVTDKDHPAMEGYCGPYAESEIETRAIVNLVNAHHFSCCIAFHTAEQTVYYNVGQKGEVFDKAEKIANLCSGINGYKLGDGESVPRGLDYNWLNLNKGIPALIIECGISWSPLPLSEFPAIWRENKDIPAAVCNMVSNDNSFASVYTPGKDTKAPVEDSIPVGTASDGHQTGEIAESGKDTSSTAKKPVVETKSDGETPSGTTQLEKQESSATKTEVNKTDSVGSDGIPKQDTTVIS